MPLFILSESREINAPGDLTVSATLKDVALHIEPIDVDNGEYVLFDSDGQFYEIGTTGAFDDFTFLPKDRHLRHARNLVETYLNRLGWTWDRTADLATNAARLAVGPGGSQGQ